MCTHPNPDPTYHHPRYEPVFRVLTLDGRLVWKRKQYLVKRADTPGSFYFLGADTEMGWKVGREGRGGRY